MRDRFKLITYYLAERLRYGLPETAGPVDREALFILDGVGRFQAAPLMIRRAIRENGEQIGTIVYDWQTWLFGEIWTDLMWLRRNRVMGGKLAHKLLAFRRSHPGVTIHLLALSGGAGIAVFACELLRGRRLVETLILACPALSPGYNLGPALRAVRRCYALVSSRDTLILGLGTRIFGTTDRKFSRGAGLVGFHLPEGISDEDREAYERIRQIRWSAALKRDAHDGGHAGWASVPFLRRHLAGLLRGMPRLDTEKIMPA